MKAYVITISGSAQSEKSARALAKSHELVGNAFELCTSPATVPGNVVGQMEEHGVVWDFPWEGTRKLRDLGMVLHAYNTTNRKARMACFMSHFGLWQRAVASGEPLLVLEDDAVFVKKLDPQHILDSEFGAVGINDPRGATRRAKVFHDAVQQQSDPICETPWVDEPTVPQGLAGHSAYIIKPWAAKAVIGETYGLGAWPNDALMCRQICPWLGVTRTYYTRVQGTPSTLS